MRLWVSGGAAFCQCSLSCRLVSHFPGNDDDSIPLVWLSVVKRFGVTSCSWSFVEASRVGQCRQTNWKMTEDSLYKHAGSTCWKIPVKALIVLYYSSGTRSTVFNSLVDWGHKKRPIDFCNLPFRQSTSRQTHKSWYCPSTSVGKHLVWQLLKMKRIWWLLVPTWLVHYIYTILLSACVREWYHSHRSWYLNTRYQLESLVPKKVWLSVLFFFWSTLVASSWCTATPLWAGAVL
jgi:hypothetical protein